LSTTPFLYYLTSTRSFNATLVRVLTYASVMMADLLAFLGAGFTSVIFRYIFHGNYNPAEYLSFVSSVIVLFSVFAIAGLYPGIAINPIDEFRRVLRSVSLVFLIIIGTTYFLREGLYASRLVYILSWALTMLLVPVSRRLIRGWCSSQRWWGIPAVILGERHVAVTMLDVLRGNPRLGLRPVAILFEEDDNPDQDFTLDGSLFSGSLSHAEHFAHEYKNCYAVVAGVRHFSGGLVETFENYSKVLIIPDTLPVNSVYVQAKDIGGVLALELKPQLTRRLPQFIKRCFDLVVSSMILTLSFPLLALLFLTVLITSPGPVFYGHRRIGRRNAEFTVWKFRTMATDGDAVLERHLRLDPRLCDEWDRTHKLRSDPRVTRIGRFLRKTSLDELPQLLNVLRGEMSLVGPRPIIRSEIPKYGQCFRQYCRVTPGITGLWQVSGRNHTTYETRIKIDDYYVRNWCVSLDLYILLRTVKTVLFAEGAY
jgi:Undecaprenyl-phosphate galactose phosphotransferase WbaP